jgi:hypothetical protein
MSITNAEWRDILTRLTELPDGEREGDIMKIKEWREVVVTFARSDEGIDYLARMLYGNDKAGLLLQTMPSVLARVIAKVRVLR